MIARLDHNPSFSQVLIYKNMWFTLLWSFLLCDRMLAASIDQRQTGDLNVQIELKNFKIFALTKGKEEYVDYDYAYDYSEMTIKPQNGTTSTTIKPLNTSDTVMQTDKVNTTLAEFEVTTRILGDNSTFSITTEKMTTINSVIANDSSTVDTTTVRNETLNNATTEYHGTSASDCKKGFFRNNKGNCELKLQNPSNTLLKMLQQKSKSNGGTAVRKS